jgi:hypothetical protein
VDACAKQTEDEDGYGQKKKTANLTTAFSLPTSW